MTISENLLHLRGLASALLFSTGVALVFCTGLHFGEKPRILAASLPLAAAQSPVRQPLIALDPAGKFLENPSTHKPVFLTGDAAWSLVVQLSDEDTELYLKDRASRGFNAIWVGLADNTYSRNPPHDFYGNVPFSGQDFTNENPVYWSRVDRILSSAASQGIIVFASPAFVGYGCKEGYCESYKKSSTDTLKSYGQFLGNRYKDYSNIIWLIGGDADPKDANLQSKLFALANGIRSTDSIHLITTEAYRGFSSEEIWPEAPWLDLNALYLEPRDIAAKANSANRSSRHPVLLFEDWYEGEHSMTPLDVREEGYWAVLSGCTLGRVFGNYAIWNFSWPRSTSDPWKPQLNSQGSVSQAWLGKLFRSREHWKLVPDASRSVMNSKQIPQGAAGREKAFAGRRPQQAANAPFVAARTADGQTIIAYIPEGKAVALDVDLRRISDSGSRANCWWFNPRSGSTKPIGPLSTNASHIFVAPDENDWLLVIDSAEANLAAPASKDL